MADSAPDPKVEDVLSSVRRLVSGEIPRRTSRPSQPAGALVLTDAQRITEKPRASGATRSLEERIAELEAAVDRSNHEFEPDGSEDQSENMPDRIVYTRPPRDDEQPETGNRVPRRLSQLSLLEGQAEDDDDSGPETEPRFRHETSRIERATDEAPMAEDAPQATVRGELHAFTNPDDVVERIEARMDTGGGAPKEEPVLALDPGKQVKPAPSQPPAQPEESKEFDAALSEAVAASIAPAPGSDERDSASKDFLDQDEVLAFVEPEKEAEAADETEAETPEPVDELAAEAEGDRLEADADAEDDDDDVPSADTVAAALDALPGDEAMRLLVRRLMKEELQGDLGERITRNVRKLVRREVMRALDSRNLM